MNSKSFYKRQISLSEWFEDFDHKDKEKFRQEDNEKRERLKVLNEVIDLPFDKPAQFKATDLTKKTSKFKDYFNKNKDEFCALRLIPNEKNLPKLRMRGLTIEKVMQWYSEQEINPEKYRADFIPHSNNPLWSTIFISNNNGVFGEIIYGMHNKLTQGFYNKHKPIQFHYNSRKLQLSSINLSAKKHINKVIGEIRVKDPKKRARLKRLLNAEFVNESFLSGYFETIETKEYGLWFIDYNRILGNYYDNFNIQVGNNKSTNLINGRPASGGKVNGIVRIVNEKNLNKVKFTDNEVLVCKMTTPDHVMLIKKSKAVVTDLGGILCHAAIIAREFGIPCVVGTINATKKLKNGDLIEVDANTGIIRKLK